MRLWDVLASVLILSLCCGTARAVDLYNGPLGTAPEDQGWLVFGGVGGNIVRTTAGGITTLDTTATNTIQAGYSNYLGASPANPAFPSLNRNDGFIVSLDMRLVTESHVSNHRAGVSLIALASDLFGIEVAFWENEIWVQSGPDFMHAEGVAFNTTAAMTSYDLLISGNTYTLSANGSAILSGNLRDYSSFGIPYDLPSFMFLGDNTTSAQGSFQFSRLAVVPEPALAMTAGSIGALVLRRRGGRR